MATHICRAFLFDLDGTLIDSTPATERAWEIWGKKLGLPNFSLDTHGVPAKNLVERYLPADQVAEGIQLINKLELEEKAGIVPKAGALDLLAALDPEDWAVVTSGTFPLATMRMQAAGIPLPKYLVTADRVTSGKPHPEPFIQGAQLVGQQPEDCLAFEDAPAGVSSATDAGCPTVGIIGTHQREDLAATFVISSLADISVQRSDDSYEVSL